MGAEPMVLQDLGTVSVRRVPGGRAVRHYHHPGRSPEEEAIQARFVFHRVLRQGRFLFQRVPVQNSGELEMPKIPI